MPPDGLDQPVDVLEELPGEARLAYAGRPDDSHETRPALAVHARPRTVLLRSRRWRCSCVTMGMFGTILFVPLFIQGVIGYQRHRRAAPVMMPMTLTIIVGSTVGGQLISRTRRYKLVALFGLTTAAFGMFLLSRMGPDASYLTVVRSMMIVGLGLGPTMPVFTHRGPERGQLQPAWRGDGGDAVRPLDRRHARRGAVREPAGEPVRPGASGDAPAYRRRR